MTPPEAAGESRPLTARAAVSVANSAASRVAEIRSTKPAEQPGLIGDYLRQTACRILGRPQTAALDLHEPLQRLGMDSLMALEFSNALQSEIGVRLPVVRFLGENTLAALVAEVLDCLREVAASDDEADEWVEGIL
jgi:acyl carrier protein